LVRISFAGIECGRLKKGEWRHLTATEISRLKKMVGLA
jgi:16S rRNA U516 pseudouridylate synthase RsuA-like enzyme